MKDNKKTTLGVIIGNRSFFPGDLCKDARERILKVIQEEDLDVVILDEESTEYGAVSTLDDAKKCGRLFAEHRHEIDGILVTLPNFGEEKMIAHTIRYADLNVPILVHAFSDDVEAMSIQYRRDSFCGKISVCNNLKQFGFKYSLTSLHTLAPESAQFRNDLRRFAATCRVVRGLRGARLGAIGVRPSGFNTVRYSERLLERAGITVEPLDLSEVLGRTNKLKEEDSKVKRKIEELRSYMDTPGIPEDALMRMAKLAVVIDDWMQDNDLVATAIQCWTAIEEYFGIAPCTIMSMMSNQLLPSACEVDVPGLVGMYALQEASGRPSVLLDWNNNYGDDPDKCVVFHCSNLAKDFFEEVKMDAHPILKNALGTDNSYGSLTGRIKESPFTFLRVSTDDWQGEISAYVGEGVFTKDPLQTFGGYGVVQINQFQNLLNYICEQGFEHHVAANLSQHAAAIHEALSKYMGWNVYYHK